MAILNLKNKKQEWETLKGLHGVNKIQHITSYYKMHISVFLGMIFLTVVLISAYKDNQTPPRLYISLFTDSSTDYSQWVHQCIDLMPDDHNNIEWIQSTYFTPSSPNSAIDKNYLSTRIGAKELDLVISTATLYEYMQELDCILSLDNILDKEQLADYRGQLVTDDFSKGNSAYAVRLDSSQFPESEAEPYYLYICSASEHLSDAAAMFQIITRR